MKKVAINQSSYIPWKGTFDMINSVDEFILFDDAQYTKNDWRNRNKIKTVNGVRWLTIPIRVKGFYPFPIYEAQVSDHNWVNKHWVTIEQSYARAPYFDKYSEQIKAVYDSIAEETHLSKINYAFLKVFCAILGINTRLSWSMDYDFSAGKTERLANVCEELGADVYLSGPAAKVYLQEEVFTAKGMQVEWMDYSGYPEYEQVHPPFDHYVSVLDLIFCTGPDAPKYMKSFR